MIDKFYKPFNNRDDALHKLLDIIHLENLIKDNVILLAISAGGLLFANEISKRTNLSLDFLFSEPIFAPKNPDCKIAIVSESMDIMINETLVDCFDISYDFIYGEAQRKYEEKILPDIYKYRKGENLRSLDKRNVLIIDEGIESGLSIGVAIKSCLKKGVNGIMVAAPVISNDIILLLDSSVDDVYSVYNPKHFVSTKHYFKHREEIDSSIIVDILDKSLSKLIQTQKG
ncbi:phosphoribosyltransferase [Helicobacter sp. MIT 99-5507]|uniref:phosphoribosyltransferase n=1 Tax=Helicobacter sp. MIT 99-5507 TaxID=152489 RepID=UPI000E1E8C42|nr:phosphoribosyltransferase family protein [Helicobacter sp. MIT 99-5507]RDU58309.1 hypothetical protein CQA42_00445 [Helicobacter sp. MIT 99-5507]